MNPKAMPRNQLLGHMDADTREWFDGVLTKSAREVVRQTTDEKSWIICDGDIDPEWIESLNSVLDDNHLLTMPSGERIQFGDNINFIFETHDLKFASPATVSRMGMVFLSEEDTDASGLIEKWIQEQPSETQGKLQNWIQQYFDNAVRFIEDSEALVVDTSKMGIIQNGLSHLKGIVLSLSPCFLFSFFTSHCCCASCLYVCTWCAFRMLHGADCSCFQTSRCHHPVRVHNSASPWIWISAQQ
jgi:dynein heavy chain 2, cytosolic